MGGVIRFGVSLEPQLLDKFDEIIGKKGYQNRSEAIRDLIRRLLIEEQWEDKSGESVGTITLVYDHTIRELSDRLTELQHEYHHEIISALHVHLDDRDCLEVLVVKAAADEARRISDRLISTRGVKHGKLVMTGTLSSEW
ncbi:MAG: nickel-responsive transcriptional regulator NikR [Bacillota bacterium]